MKILIISPFFFPSKAVGALRMTSLVRYLTQYDDIEITVIKNAEPSSEKLQPICKEIEVNSRRSDYLSAFFAYKKACKKAVKKEKYDWCIISCGPFYTLLCGVYLKSRYNIPYILDYRDFWDNERIQTHLTIKRTINLLAVKNSQAVTVVSPGMKNRLLEDYHYAFLNVHVIMNGYEAVTIKEKEIEEKETDEDRFVVGILGKFSYYSPQHAKEFLEAVSHLRESGINIQILHIGDEERELVSLLEQYNLKDHSYMCTGRVTYDKALSYMARTNCGLLITADEKIGYGTKIFDYIMLNKPMIIISSESQGEYSQLAEEFENAYVASRIGEIINILNMLYSNKISKLTNREKTEKYDRKYQNKKFEKLLRAEEDLKNEPMAGK
ncbi:glycosyltransferase [uncultured Clostridium sp.]|uniref:glycosyltransferase n=1 Tax=uncultured Clostridium sp. TaxID=59620 RepID=UPI0025D80CB2|nr:glycosyltransferase [uncultured Clostridium sp.]